MAVAQRPEILLITENKTVLLELGHDGKFSAKSTAWEEVNDYEARPMAVAQRPEILLITENKTVLLELGHDGKFSAKSTAWEENKVILPGEEVVIRVDGGRWFIVRRPAQGAMVGSGAPAQAATVTEEILDAPVAPNRARCAATAYFPRATHWSLTRP